MTSSSRDQAWDLGPSTLRFSHCSVPRNSISKAKEPLTWTHSNRAIRYGEHMIGRGVRAMTSCDSLEIRRSNRQHVALIYYLFGSNGCRRSKERFFPFGNKWEHTAMVEGWGNTTDHDRLLDSATTVYVRTKLSISKMFSQPEYRKRKKKLHVRSVKLTNWGCTYPHTWISGVNLASCVLRS